jgi:hypothetical protein
VAAVQALRDSGQSEEIMVNSQLNSESRWTFGARLTLAIAVAWIVGAIGISLITLQFLSDGWTHIREGVTGTYPVGGRLVDGVMRKT